MMDWTDRHCRHFHRLLTQNSILYTEMVTTGALLHGDTHRFLRFDSAEHPIALQLGGNDPKQLAQCSQIAFDYGYDEINLNVGCPSDRVQSGRFGACLMKQANLVADCVDAMRAKVHLPVTVKCRIGVDDFDQYEFLHHFIETITAAGCSTFIIHARKAWLQGLSPKQNREIPPLHYDTVYQIKKDFPHLHIVINGGIKTYENIEQQLQHIDGVMIGREAYQNPYFLAELDHRFCQPNEAIISRQQVVEGLLPYVEQQLSDGVPLKSITRHILGLFNSLPGARAWRRHLSTESHKPGADAQVILDALAFTSA